MATQIELLPANSTAPINVFEVETEGAANVVLRGTNAISLGSALRWYLKERCLSLITWEGSNIVIPFPVPVVSPAYRAESPYELEFYMVRADRAIETARRRARELAERVSQGAAEWNTHLGLAAPSLARARAEHLHVWIHDHVVDVRRVGA